MDLKEFMNLTKSKKAYWLTREYFKKCTEKSCFIGGKVSSEFFKVRHTFILADETELNNMFCFINSLDSKHILSLSFLWDVAEEWNRRNKEKIIANSKVSDYKPINIMDLDML